MGERAPTVDPYLVDASQVHPGRSCEACHLAVGTYEPATFCFGDQVVHSSRAADPSLVHRPDLITFHRDCYAARYSCAGATTASSETTVS